MRHAHALVIALSVCLCLCASAQDRDGDGLTDEMEERIGMDAGHAETFEEVAKDKTKEQGDPVGKENYAPGLDVVAVHLANVAGNRWVWRIDFLEEIPAKNLNLIIYVQADNDTGTGRRDVHGIDYMVVFSRDSAGLREFTSDGSEIPQRAGGGTVVGRAVYLVADMNLQQVAGRTHCSANVLVETRIPHKTVDSMKRFDIDVAGQNDRPLPKRASDALVSEGVFQTWGMDSMRGVRANSANRVLPIQNCRMHGFVYDHFTEYHMPNARIKESGPYWVEIDIPATGRYHLGFIVYDCAGRQVYRLLLNGKPLGVAVAAAGVNRQTLFASEDAHVLQQGDVFRVQLLNREGNPRIEDLLLLRKLPKRRALARELKHLVGTAVRDEVTGTISGRITFTTNWPAKAVVAYGPDRSFSQSFEEAEAEANHRLFLPGLAPGATCRFRLRVTTPEGETIERKGRFKTTLPVPVGRVERARIALRLRNPQPADASLWPVTQGVPFPQGALGDGRRVRLMMAGGERLPLQTRVSARWPDGSVKWLLVDTQLPVKAKQDADLVLEYGTAIEPLEMTGGISVTETEKEVVIDAGVLTLSLPRRGAVFPAQVRLNGQELLSPALTRVVSDKGEGRSTDVENRIRVIESGPLRTVIRVERTIAVTEKDHFLDSYDLHIYRGLPFFRVFHTWTNSNQASEWSNLHRWVLGARMTLGEGTKIGAGGKTMGPASKGVFLTQVFENERTVMRGSQRSPADSGVPGMLVASGPRGAVSVAVRHFSELYPKKLGMGQEEDGQLVLAVDIMPLIGDKTYAFSKPGKLEDKLFYYLKDGHYRLRQGVSKRHELLFGFDAESAGNLALLLEAPPVLASDPDWYCTSGVFTDVLPSSPELGGIYREYDLATEKSLGAYLERRRTGREYGMLNFGDWWGERGRNWGNIEYDTQHAFYLQFIRSGQLGFLRTGEEACRHNMDVDMVRSHRDSHRVGKVYAHCIGHTGGYYKHAINNQGSPRGGMSITHSWIDGYLDNYFLTGDVRGLESARMLIDNYDHHYLRNYDYNNNRHSGWHLVNTLAMYRATSDPYYLNAARIIMERVSEREMSDGGWTRQLTPGHCLCMPRHRGEAAFMTGILLTGLKDYHEITGDEHVGDMIVRGAKNIIRATWVPERNSMRYTSCPASSVGSGLSTLVTEGILHAFALGGDPETGEVALAATLQAGSRVNSFGKGLSQQMRVTPHFLAQLRQLRLTEMAFVLDGTPVTLLLKHRPKTPFSVVVRPREGAESCRAELRDAAGRVVFERSLSGTDAPARLTEALTPEAGQYTLTLVGRGVWAVDSYLSQMTVRAEQEVTLAPSPCPRFVFVAPSAKVRIRPRAKARLVSDVYAAPLGTVRSLRVYTIPAGKTARVRVDGGNGVFAPWSQFWFGPGQPVAVIKADWRYAGDQARLQLDASSSVDPDGKIVQVRWLVDGDEAGEGTTIEIPLGEGMHTILLRVRDDSGLEGEAKTTVRLAPVWLRRPGTIMIEAEDFSSETGGKVKVHERKSSGKMITAWHADKGHTLSWTINVPTAGRYAAALKYCTAFAPRRDFRIDGAPPHSGLKQFDLKATGGFSTSRDDWQYLLLGARDGAPHSFQLTAGRHVISMSNLGDGCALDQLFLVPVDK